MKKIFGFIVAAAAAATMFVSCGNSSSAKVETVNDTINYAFGAANGAGIKQYVLGDTATAEQISQFCKGIEKTFVEKADRAASIEFEGYRMGTSMKKEIQSGYLLNDSSIPANKELILSVFSDGMHGKMLMPALDAMERFRGILSESLATGESANLTKELADSINIYFAIVNAQGARNFLLGADTTEKMVNIFLKGINEGINSDDSNNWLIEGSRIGSTLSQQLKMSKNLFNDSTMPEVNFAVIKLGLFDELKGNEGAVMSGADAQNYLNKLMEARQAAAQAVQAEKNKEIAAEGEAFLAENKTKEGVVTTESGLQYKVIKMGKGAKPAATDKVRVHYHGTLIDGTVFDSSVERGEPTEFPLNAVIKGWTEGLQLMPVGSKFVFYIPYQLAYGERGAGDMIGPCQALIFEVELLEIVK